MKMSSSNKASLKINSASPTGGPPQASLNERAGELTRTMPFSPGLLLIPVIAVLTIVLLVFLLSENPAKTFYFFFAGPLRNVYSFGNMLNSAIPLVLGALGLTVAMKAGSFNLGGEGQIYLGAFCTSAAALALSNFGAAGAIIAVIAGMLASGALAAISGFCKARWNTNELITTFLLSSAVIPIVNFLVNGPFLDPETSLQSTKKIAESMRLPIILRPSNLSAAVFFAIALVIIVHFFLSKTKLGYEFRMAGNNEIFARYGGINTKRNTVIAMAISGGLYGLAGSLCVLGTYHATVKEFSAGLGWNALAVALIACFYPAAIIPAAVFFAWISSGARAAMQNTGLNLETASIVQAVIFLFSTSLLLRNIFSNSPRGRRAHNE